MRMGRFRSPQSAIRFIEGRAGSRIMGWRWGLTTFVFMFMYTYKFLDTSDCVFLLIYQLSVLSHHIYSEPTLSNYIFAITPIGKSLSSLPKLSQVPHSPSFSFLQYWNFFKFDCFHKLSLTHPVILFSWRYVERKRRVLKSRLSDANKSVIECFSLITGKYTHVCLHLRP